MKEYLNVAHKSTRRKPPETITQNINDPKKRIEFFFIPSNKWFIKEILFMDSVNPPSGLIMKFNINMKLYNVNISDIEAIAAKAMINKACSLLFLEINFQRLNKISNIFIF